MTSFDFSPDPLLTANIENSILRHAAEILEDEREGIFVYDREGELYMLYAPAELGKRWLQKHEDRHYECLILYDDALITWAAERYGFIIDEKCASAVWTKAELPRFERRLTLRRALESEFSFCREIYRHSSDSDVREALRRGNVLLGFLDSTLVGMIGLHAEGSMGMLEVLPEYRCCGFGTELELTMVTLQLERGLIPYSHVYRSNHASLALHEHLGMRVSQGSLTWLYFDD